MLQKLLRSIDFTLLSLVIGLLSIGLVTLYSASSGNIHLVLKQLSHAGLGFSIMFALAITAHANIKDFAPIVYFVGNLLLVAVLALGFISKGAQRWLGVGGLHIQPSELMKIFLPLCLCWFFDHREYPPRIKTICIGFLVTFIPFFLVYKQPDLGTAIVLLSLAAIAILLAGISRKFITIITLSLAGSLPLLWQHMHDYQKKRVLTFLNPESDPLGAGYHIMQSKIAIGSGGIWGKGFMQGTQAHLNFLPEHTTDFIFAVIAEEFGFIGCATVVLLVLAITLRMVQLSKRALPGFCHNACICFAGLFFISAIVNMAMVVGLLPVVGIPLPFISYGGSNMLITCSSIGIVMALKNNWREIN